MSRSFAKYKITDKTLIHIGNIEKFISIIDHCNVSNIAKSRIVNECLFDDLCALNNFLNLGLTLGEVKKISIGKDINTTEAKLLSNIKQVTDFIRNNFKEKEFVFNFHFVQHIVKLVQSNMLELWDIGKIRTGGEIIDKKFELENQTYFRADTTNFLAEHILWVEEEKNVHPIIKACVFMTFINRYSPFVGLNYISSLVFFRLILDKFGYNSIYRLPLLKLLSINRQDFQRKINEIAGNDLEISDFIELVSANLYELIYQYKKSLIKFDHFDMKFNSNRIDLNERQVSLLKILQHKVFIRRYEYVKLFKVSPMTAYRDLKFMVERKILVASGNGKSTAYSLSTR